MWMQKVTADPGHSHWYVERFRAMARAGDDVVGEARFVDAMAPRGARILDAGCGPGRLGGHLAAIGHDVVGVDVDPVLIEAAEHDHPGPTIETSTRPIGTVSVTTTVPVVGTADTSLLIVRV